MILLDTHALVWWRAAPEKHAVPVTPEIAALAASLTMQGDPADRIIVATALQERSKLVTRDDAIVRANVVDTVWD